MLSLSMIFMSTQTFDGLAGVGQPGIDLSLA